MKSMSNHPNDDLFEDTKMSFGSHLEELRVSLFRGVVGLLVQAVGMRADITRFDTWGDRAPETALVVIASEHVDRAAITALLDSAAAGTVRNG